MNSTQPDPREPRTFPYSVRIVGAFLAIYVVWGSTYLAIRYAVAEVPPLFTAGFRHLSAGLVLYAWARRTAARVTLAEWRASAVLGLWFFLLGHGSLHWAEQTVPSGLAALLVATEPLWIAVGLALKSRSRITLRTMGGLATGLAGVGVLFRSNDLTLTPDHALAAVAVLGGALAWAVGIVYARDAPLPSSASLRAATTLVCGGLWLLGASALSGEPVWGTLGTVSPVAVGSLAYLVLFGSLVAYSSYLWLLDRCSPTLVATHTYVNPLVAIVIGWVAGDGVLDGRVAVSCLLILGAIVLVRERPRGPESRALPRRATGH